MTTTFQCYGHLEQGDGMTVWELYPFEPMPQFADWLLPANGIYRGARYYVSVTLSEQRQGHDRQVGRYSSQVELRGVGDEEKELTDPDAGPEISDGFGGMLGLLGLVPEWHGDDTECWVTVSFEYDPGLTALWNDYSRDDLIEWQGESEYTHPDNPVSQSDRLDPDPDHLPETLTKTFPEVGLELDYRGVIEGSETSLRLPMGARHGFVRDETLVLLLDRKRGGVSDPTVEVPDDRNLVGIGPDCTLEWVIDEPAKNRFSSLWVQDGTVMADGYKTWYEIDSATGAVESVTDHYRGRF